MEIQESRLSSENAISKALNAEQKPPSACSRPGTSSGNSKRYLHSGMTPRLNDIHSRPRHRSSTSQNVVASSKSKASVARDSKSTESIPRHESTKSNTHSAHESPDDEEARTRRQRVLTSAHRRWRSSDRLNPRIISKEKDFQETKSSFFQKRVLQITGSKPRLHSEPTANLSKDKSNGAEIYYAEPKDCPSVSPDLYSIVRSENEFQSDSNPNEIAEQCETRLSGHPFILQNEQSDNYNASVNIPNKAIHDSNNWDSHHESQSLKKTTYSDDGNKRERGLSKNEDKVDNKATGENAKIKGVKSNSPKRIVNEIASLEYGNESLVVTASEPPKVAKCAWGAGLTKQTEASVENSSDIMSKDIDPDENSHTEAKTRPGRHWANIEHRAATRNAALVNSSPRDPSPAPLVKSKSTWRIHAAKARESVAGLLNFTKAKDASSSPSKRLKADSKLRPHHKSSPCLNTSLIQDSLTVYSGSSKHTSSQRGIDKQTSSPELFAMSVLPDNNAVHTSELYKNEEEQDSFNTKTEGTIQQTIAPSIPLQVDDTRVKTMEVQNISRVLPSTSLTNFTSDIQFEEISHTCQDTGDKTENKELLSHSLQKCLSRKEGQILEDEGAAYHKRPISLSENDSKLSDASLNYVPMENKSNEVMDEEESTTDSNPADDVLHRSESPSMMLEETNSDQEHSMAFGRTTSPIPMVGMMRTLQAAQNHLNKAKFGNQKSGEDFLSLQSDESVMDNSADNQFSSGMHSDCDNINGDRKGTEINLTKTGVLYTDMKDKASDMQSVELEVCEERNLERNEEQTNSSNRMHTESNIRGCVDSEKMPLRVRTTNNNNTQKTIQTSVKGEMSWSSCPTDTSIRSSNVEGENQVLNEAIPSSWTDEEKAISDARLLFPTVKETDGIIQYDGIFDVKDQGKERTQGHGVDNFDVNKARPEHREATKNGNQKDLENVCAHVGWQVDGKTNREVKDKDTLCYKDIAGSTESRQEHETQIERLHSKPSTSLSKGSTGSRKVNERATGGDDGGGKRDRSRRVENMLNNQVFQKHLAKHADTIERRVFGIGKRGMRKALSNFDLSTDQSDMLGDVMRSIFRLDDTSTNNNNNDGSTNFEASDICVDEEENSLHKISRCVSLYEKSSASLLNNNSSDADDTASITSETSNKGGRFLRKAASSFLLRHFANDSPENSDSIGAKKDRRMSSVFPRNDHKLLNDSHNMHTKRRRMHIPSFNEYRQKRLLNDEPGSSVDPEHYRQDGPINGIYVIEESEQDAEIQRLSVETTTSNNIKERKDYVKGSRNEVAIFSHPAIVITTEHCSQLKNSNWSSETRSSRRKRNADMKATEMSSKQNYSSPAPKAIGESGSSQVNESLITVVHSDPQNINGKRNETEEQSSCFNKLQKEQPDERLKDEQSLVDVTDTMEWSPDIESVSLGTLPDDQSLPVCDNVCNSSLTMGLLTDSIPPKTDEIYEEMTKEGNCFSKPSTSTNIMGESLGFSVYNNSKNNKVLPPEDTLTYFYDERSFEIENIYDSNTDAARKSLHLNFNQPSVDSVQLSSSSPTPGGRKEVESPIDSILIKETVRCSSSPAHEGQGSPKEISVSELQLSDASAHVYDEDLADDVSRSSATLSRWSPSSSASDSDQSNKTSVLRSTSDVSATLSDEKERRRRERKERPYKSDPFTGTITRPQSLLSPDTPIQSCLSASTSCSFHSLDELDEQSDTNSVGDDEESKRRKRQNRISTASSASEDSGVSSHGWNEWKSAGGCAHCSAFGLHGASSPSSPSGLEVESLSSIPASSQCNKCLMRKRERKETIQEMAETEKRYGRDLAILKDEFYRHMKSTSLLTLDQLDAIFMNLDELMTVHKHFMGKLTSALINAVREGDEGFSSVNVGDIFVESSKMFLAFEHYCVNQSQSSTLLEQLEKEKELLKVFLQAAQNENAKMRRMHLKTFLMVPVQRVMKYPLLLGRLNRVTPCYHSDKTNIRQARDNIEDILEQINSKTKTSRPKTRSLQIQGYSLSEKIEVNRTALEVLGWSKKEVCDIVTSRLWYGQVPDHTWASKRARNVKFSMVHAALLSHGRPTESPISPRDPPHVLQVAMVLVREKAGRYQIVREPLLMDRCVVTVDPEYDQVFELHEQGKDTYLFKAETRRETNTWTGHLKQLSRHLGYWRRRRNGLPNVLLKTA